MILRWVELSIRKLRTDLTRNVRKEAPTGVQRNEQCMAVLRKRPAVPTAGASMSESDVAVQQALGALEQEPACCATSCE